MRASRCESMDGIPLLPRSLDESRRRPEVSSSSASRAAGRRRETSGIDHEGMEADAGGMSCSLGAEIHNLQRTRFSVVEEEDADVDDDNFGFHSGRRDARVHELSASPARGNETLSSSSSVDGDGEHEEQRLLRTREGQSNAADGLSEEEEEEEEEEDEEEEGAEKEEEERQGGDDNEKRGKVQMQRAECRICQEEDDVDQLETPCACAGSLKFAHHGCIQRWCTEKGNTVCEICHTEYVSKMGFHAPPPAPIPSPFDSGSVSIRLGEATDSVGRPLARHRIMLRDTVTGEEHVVDINLGAEEMAADAAIAGAGAEARAADCWKCMALIIVALFFMSHVIALAVDSSDSSMVPVLMMVPFFALFAAARAVRVQQQQEEEAAALTAAEMAVLLRMSQESQSLRFALASLAAPPPMGPSGPTFHPPVYSAPSSRPSFGFPPQPQSPESP